jgi:hypothetical protein
MTNYQNGKIYKIEALNGEEGDVYIGSTCKQYLSQRLQKHKESYAYWKRNNKLSNTRSYLLFEKYGVENCTIVLIETSPCDTHDELFSREAFHIKSLKCVNKCIPLQTMKEWYDINRDRILEKVRVDGIIKITQKKYARELKNGKIITKIKFLNTEKITMKKIKIKLQNTEKITIKKRKKFFLNDENNM